MAAAWGGDNRAMPAVLNPSPLFLPCAAGVEPLLADEVRAILTAAGAPRAAESVRAERGGVLVLQTVDAQIQPRAGQPVRLL